MFDSHFGAGHGGSGLASITVFPNRQRFEAGISRMLKPHASRFAPCAVLHVALRGERAGTGSIGRHVLNLAGNTLRVAMKCGALAYLGDAEFAALLWDCDHGEAEEYAYAIADVISGFRMSWEDESFSVTACIGGVMARDCQDGAFLLNLATAAGELARRVPQHKVHIMQGPEEWVALSDDCTPALLVAAGA